MERIDYIETKIAFIENTVIQLEKVAAEQERRIDTLFAENAFLKQKLKDLQEDTAYLPHEKPPHY